jgi:REP element-mobilizing transposase RayT
MARELRVLFEGAIYHITNRGNEKREIFKDEKDRRVFLGLVRKTVAKYGWICYGYCLMDNHYHLLIETPKPNLSDGMKKINGEYSQYFNFRHARIGHLFQGRYKAVLVNKESHLLELCRYIVLNPVRAGLIKRPDDYEWTSYAATVGKKRKHFVERKWILDQFAENGKSATALYSDFVNVEATQRSLTMNT